MTDDVQKPCRGDFQWYGMSGAFEPTVEAMAAERGYFGFVPEATYIWGTFRDERGKVSIFMRRLPFHGLTEPPKETGTRSTIGRRAVLFAQDEADRIDVHMASMATGYNTETLVERAGDSLRWHIPAAGEKRRAMNATVSPSGLKYCEDGLIDVAGPLLKPGLHWYLPGRDAGLYYASPAYPCTGTILGKQVTGFLFIEQAYMLPDSVLYMVNDVLVGAKTHLTWYSFATEYEDGETQFGHFIVGHDRLGIGVVANQSGVLVNSSTVNARVARRPDGWSDRVDLDVDGGHVGDRAAGVAAHSADGAHAQPPAGGHLPACRREAQGRALVGLGETAHGTHREHRYAPLYRRA